jgi:hypothetical protein
MFTLGMASAALGGQIDRTIRGSLLRCDRYHRSGRQEAINVRKELSATRGFPAHGISKHRQVHGGHHMTVDPAEMFVQRRSNLGPTRQMDVAIRNIRRRSMKRAITLHLLQVAETSRHYRERLVMAETEAAALWSTTAISHHQSPE